MTTTGSTSDTTSDTNHTEEIELLERILSPLGEQRSEHLLALAEDYLENVSPITWCAGRSEPGEELEAVVWQLGKPSPLSEDRTVFAIFDWPEYRCCVAYSFSAVQAQGQDGALGYYHREKVYNPRYSTGPISLTALFKELVALTRKSHHHVRADGCVGHPGASLLHAIGVMLWPILAMHAPQRPVAAALQRCMDMLCDARRFGHQV